MDLHVLAKILIHSYFQGCHSCLKVVGEEKGQIKRHSFFFKMVFNICDFRQCYGLCYGDQYEVRVDNYGLKKMYNCIKKEHNTKIIIIKCRKTVSDQVTVIQYEDSVSQTMPKSHLSISINILPTHLQCVYLNSEFQNILFVA